MGGGLLNLVAYGNKNVIINGNPSKTFFKTTYAKYTNFGLQKFRIDFEGPKTLRENTDSHYEFVVPKYADLLMDTYFVITMPNIWSSVYCPNVAPPCVQFLNRLHPLDLERCIDGLSDKTKNDLLTQGHYCQPYEFKWIENLGAQLIRRVRYTIGGHIIQEFTGQYLYAMVQRDFSAAKKDLFNEMTGNVPQMNDPANYANNKGNYPNYLAQSLDCEPSIRGRKLYIPLNIWSTLSSKLALPLVCLQKNQLKIEIDCRPVRELFVVRDINYYLTNNWDVSANVPPPHLVINTDISYAEPPYISTNNLVDPKYQMYLFLTQSDKTFLSLSINGVEFDPDRQSNWYADPHLISTYGFIGREETRQFMENPPSYLIRGIHENTYQRGSAGGEKFRFSTTGLVASWMWFFQRDDVNLRNEWSNYTNWSYNYLPYPCISVFDISKSYISNYPKPCPPIWSKPTNNIGPTANPYAPPAWYNDASYSTLYMTGPYHAENNRDIMKSWSMLCDGALRENTLSGAILNRVEKYVRTEGNAPFGLYCYNFCLTTDPFQYQPSGSMNLTKFHNIEWEYTTFRPAKDLSSQLLMVCDPNNIEVGYNKIDWLIYNYDYILHIMEERYNILKFENGNIKLEFMHNG